MYKQWQKFFLASTLSLLLLSNLFSIEIKKTSEKSFPIEAGGTVAVLADEGFIHVSSWDKSEVRVVWTKRVWAKTSADAEKIMELLEVRFIQNGNRLHIKLVEPRDQRHFDFWDLLDPDTWSKGRRSPVVDFEVTVPREINLNLEADEGDVSVSSVQGYIDISADEGDIRLAEIQFFDLNLSVDEGDVVAENLINPEGRISIDVDEGTIMLTKVQTRKTSIQCDEGDVSVKNLSCADCTVSADEGDIELEITLSENDRYYTSTDEGDVVLILPEDPDVRFDLRTQDGRIRSDFDVRIKKRDDYQECQDRLGAGAALIKAATDEGLIYLRKY